MIPFSRPSFDAAEGQAVAQVLAEGRLGWGGAPSRAAAQLLEQLHGGGRALLTPSCTAALELAARVLDLRPGDEVIVPAYTFVSTAAAFALHGATPVFVDVRPDTLNLDPRAAEAAITSRTRAICLVHYAGVGADPDRFAELAERHGLALVEDNAHGIGASFRRRVLGTFGAMSTLSFSIQKNVTCGEGGMLLVNDHALVEHAEILQDRGTDRPAFLRGERAAYTWTEIGSNWVMSDLHAAVLLSQLQRSSEIRSRRRARWDRYAAELRAWAGEAVRLPSIPAGADHNAHIFHLRLASLEARTRFVAHLAERGIEAAFHYQALNLSPVGRRLGGRPGACPVAEQATDTLVRLPLHDALTDADQARVVDAVVSAPTGF